MNSVIFYSLPECFFSDLLVSKFLHFRNIEWFVNGESC